MANDLSPEAVWNGLRTNFLGQHVVFYATVGSTNSTAKTLAQQGAVEGTLVIADEQTSGRGRLGRRWLAPPASCLLFSLIFRPELGVSHAQRLTMVCGLGVTEGIREATGLRARLKWPNDIMLGGRKAGGILTEASSTGEHLDNVVVGIGLNVNLQVTALPSEFNATSIQHELGHQIPRVSLLQRILRHIEERYSALQAGQSPVQDWAAALETLGRQVELRTEQGTWQGLAAAVDDEGALLLRLDDGQLKRVLVGDILPRQEA
jgi:BirA family biotin operon repressor/biotin-[acetyl-CoA-carboxylase] ligase